VRTLLSAALRELARPTVVVEPGAKLAAPEREPH
jgi:hypothetical protein